MKKKNETTVPTPQTKSGASDIRQDAKQTSSYQPPVTSRISVETEGGFCAASVVDPDKNNEIKATGHEIGGTFDFSSSNDEQWK